MSSCCDHDDGQGILAVALIVLLAIFFLGYWLCSAGIDMSRVESKVKYSYRGGYHATLWCGTIAFNGNTEYTAEQKEVCGFRDKLVEGSSCTMDVGSLRFFGGTIFRNINCQGIKQE